jgi:hypothetical protein
METLLAVCRSLPFRNRVIGYTWGHDFGGLYFQNTTHCPWERIFTRRPNDSAIHQIAAMDPYSIPEISELPLREPAIPPPSYTGRLSPSEQALDPFVLLPPELTRQVALHLPTADALNARLASRSFLSIFDCHQFWASRFQAGAERSWLFESKHWDKSCKWQWLYHLTNKSHSTPGMRNRQRVFKLIHHIQSVLCRIPQSPSFVAVPGPEPEWVEVSGDLQEGQSFNTGCRASHTQYTSIPRDMSRLTFSFIQVGLNKYIAGIRITGLQSPATGLGYATDDECSLDLTCLEGLELAIVSGGIQAIRCKLDDGQISQWYGSPQNACYTRRLAHLSAITAIKAGFDVSCFPFPSS